MLAYYSQHFNTVELNNTFYKLPSKNGLLAWRNNTPRDFHFSAKGSRFLTHMKKLANAQHGLERFLDAIKPLDPKLGPMVFQLPPNWEMNKVRFREFLQLLPHKRRVAFEFRNPTWNTPEVDELLKRHNRAYCIFDLAGYLSPLKVTADFAYIRLHGPGGKYQGSYTDVALKGWARRIKQWANRLDAVYVYFDNDDSGYAPRDALRLKGLVEKRQGR